MSKQEAPQATHPKDGKIALLWLRGHLVSQASELYHLLEIEKVT